MAVNALAHMSVPATRISGPRTAPSCEIACHCGLCPSDREHNPMPSAMPPKVVIRETHTVLALPITDSAKPNATKMSGISMNRRPKSGTYSMDIGAVYQRPRASASKLTLARRGGNGCRMNAHKIRVVTLTSVTARTKQTVSMCRLSHAARSASSAWKPNNGFTDCFTEDSMDGLTGFAGLLCDCVMMFLMFAFSGSAVCLVRPSVRPRHV